VKTTLRRYAVFSKNWKSKEANKGKSKQGRQVSKQTIYIAAKRWVHYSDSAHSGQQSSTQLVNRKTIN